MADHEKGNFSQWWKQPRAEFRGIGTLAIRDDIDVIVVGDTHPDGLPPVAPVEVTVQRPVPEQFTQRPDDH